MNVLKYPTRVILRQRKVLFVGNFRNCISCFNQPEVFPLNKKYISTYDTKPLGKIEGAINKVIHKIPFLNVNKLKIRAAGYMLYENIADRIDYAAFFEEYDLSDTFYSWFVVTELYIWMLSTRAMAEGDEGQLLRNSIVEAFWLDVSQRLKRLGGLHGTSIQEQVRELSEQLHAALIGYDEGLHFDDITLAGALWRRMYQMDALHPEYLEKLVKHIRKQVKLLDNISREHLFISKSIKWLPVRNAT